MNVMEAVNRFEATNAGISNEPRRLPLDEVHARDGARFVERDGFLVPQNYADARAEYAAVREGGVGVIDFSARGRIEVKGSEATQFLNGLITNDMKTLAANAWMRAIFPNVQGRMIASARVMRAGETEAFLIDTEAATYKKVLQTVSRFTLAGDFHVTDLTNETAQISIQGAKASEILQEVFGVQFEDRARDWFGQVAWRDLNVNVLRATHTGEDGFDLILNAADAPALWDALKGAGASAVGFDALEVLRIEAGIPRFGVDISETTVVPESALDDAVSYTKGCYVGQEIIARIKYRGHVAKRLSGILFDEDVTVAREAKVKTSDGSRDIGRITSSAFSPRLNRTVALGFVRYEFLAAGTEIAVTLDEARTARACVVELPFVRGSWYANETNEKGEAR
jgi:folate-binding protein YgfZ